MQHTAKGPSERQGRMRLRNFFNKPLKYVGASSNTGVDIWAVILLSVLIEQEIIEEAKSRKKEKEYDRLADQLSSD
jgi:hypothetical protein